MNQEKSKCNVSKIIRDAYDGTPILNEAFLSRPIEICPVIQRCPVRRGTPKNTRSRVTIRNLETHGRLSDYNLRRFPRVQVRIEVDNTNFAISAVDRAQERQYNRMVPTKC